jgi:hypothetical protein
LEKETLALKDQTLDYKVKIADLESMFMKGMALYSISFLNRAAHTFLLLSSAGVKIEEAARFIRARDEPGFAVNIRQLGPEHLENQDRLRKSLHVGHLKAMVSSCILTFCPP